MSSVAPPVLTVHISGPLTISISGDALIRTLTESLPGLLSQATITRSADAPDFAAEIPTSSRSGATLAVVDASPTAVQAVDAAAAATGWTVALAQRWLEHDSATGRVALRTVVASGGIATPADMAAALGRDITAPHTFTGVFSGTAKRFKSFQMTAGAAALAYPVVTVYDEDIIGRQTAKAFALPAGTFDVFNIALATFDDSGAAA